MLAAISARNRGRMEETIKLADEAVTMTTDPLMTNRALNAKGMSTLFQGDPAEAADIWLEMDSVLGGCRGMLFGAMCAAYMGQIERAEEILDECWDYLESGVPVEVEANGHMVAGEVARIAGSPWARESHAKGAAVAREDKVWYSFGVAQVSYVSILAAEGETKAAAEGYIELIERWVRSATWPQIWTTLRNVAELLDSREDETRLGIWAAAHKDRLAPALDDETTAHEAELRDEARRNLGAARADHVEDAARRSGRATVTEQALAALRRLAGDSA